MTQRSPAETFPVGDFLKEEMDARGWNQTDLAQVVGCSARDIHGLVSGKVPLKPKMATLLGDAFGTSPEYWMNLETSYRAWLTSRATRDEVARRGRLYQIAPIREMQKRGWISATQDVAVLESDVARFYGASDLNSVENTDFAIAARMSADYAAPVSGALRAWAIRAKTLAAAINVNREFSQGAFDDCIGRLKLLLAEPMEVRHVPRILADHGIRFLIVQHLPQTKVDGACLWLGGKSPIVVMSMRYERLDWFWFTLMHELKHAQAGDGRNDEGTIDSDLVGKDAVSSDGKPPQEMAADDFAASTLVNRREIDNFIARVKPLYSKDRISSFAKRIEVHPSLVVGQLQHRGEIPFFHSREMLSDKIRKIVTTTTMTDGWDHAPF